MFSPRTILTASRFSARRTLVYFEGGKLADGTIFRRPLPAPAIELSSPQGTRLCAEALQDGTAKCFFRLMEQLHTQNEPEYCGLATLVTVLNALNVDPHRRWKGIWRFYSEELLDCCEPLHKVKTSGINFDKLASLARCNGLRVDAIRAQDTTLDSFRNMVLESSRSEDFTLTLAYSRKILNQTGSGHYSPMGAYHVPSDHLLILDCARFKYRPHWVPVPLMFEAMKAIDLDTQKTRGFMKMSPVEQYGRPPAAHVLSLGLRSQPGSNPEDLHIRLRQIASTAQNATEFLSHCADALESCLELEFKGHGCGSPARKMRILEQLTSVKDWDPEAKFGLERVQQRKSLVLSLDHPYLNELLHERPALRDEVIGWVKLPESAGELAVELSFTRPHVQAILDSNREKQSPEFVEITTGSSSPHVHIASSPSVSFTPPDHPTNRPIRIQQIQRG